MKIVAGKNDARDVVILDNVEGKQPTHKRTVTEGKYLLVFFQIIKALRNTSCIFVILQSFNYIRRFWSHHENIHVILASFG